MNKTTTKIDYLIKSFKEKKYLDRNWVLSTFSIALFNNKKLEGVVHRENTYTYFIEDGEEVVITDAEKDVPLYKIGDKIEVLYGLLSNIETNIVTTYGNLLFNACVIDYAFGNKIGYRNSVKECSIGGTLEKIIADRLVSGLAPKDNTDKEKIYIDELFRFNEGVSYLIGFNFSFISCVTEQLLTPPPNNIQLRKELIEKTADKIGQPAVLAEVIADLEKNDKEYLKADPNNNKFMNNKIKIARRKMFLMVGGEPGLSAGDTLDVATNSLAEGMEISKFTTYNNIARSGSLNRGYQTQLGGVVAKELIRATSNVKVVKGDCGTKMGRVIKIDETNYERQLVGLYVYNESAKDFVLVKNKENAGKYLGKVVTRRSPMFCMSSDENFCEVCVGSRLAKHPTGVSMSITEIGGTLLGIFMAAMHAKDLKVHDVTLDMISQ